MTEATQAREAKEAPEARATAAALAALLLAACAAGPAFAGGPGSRGAEALKFAPGPRAFAMGEAQTALAQDAAALHLNPAGLAFAEYREASIAYNAWVEGITHQSLVYAHPHARWGTFAGGVARLSVGDVEAYDDSNLRLGDVTASDTVLSAGYAGRLGGLGWGLGAKWLQEDLAGTRASSYAFDLGVQGAAEAGPVRIGYGAALLNAGPGLKFDRETARLPTALKLGASATRDFFGDPFSAALDVALPSDDDRLTYALGLEGGVKGVLALRAGYRVPHDLGSGFSFGMGLKAKNVRLDYAFLLLGDFGPTHRFGISLRFGEHIEVSRDRDRVLKARSHKQRGRQYLESKRYLEAMEQLNAAIALDPLDEESVRLMREAYDAMR